MASTGKRLLTIFDCPILFSAVSSSRTATRQISNSFRNTTCSWLILSPSRGERCDTGLELQNGGALFWHCWKHSWLLEIARQLPMGHGSTYYLDTGRVINNRRVSTWRLSWGQGNVSCIRSVDLRGTFCCLEEGLASLFIFARKFKVDLNSQIRFIQDWTQFYNT